MVSVAEYLSTLLGDNWRGQAPVGRRGMSAIFGASVTLQDEAPSEADSVVIVGRLTAPDSTDSPLLDAVLYTVGALLDRIDGVRTLPLLFVPGSVELDSRSVSDPTTMLDEAGVGYDAVLSGRLVENAGSPAIEILDGIEGGAVARIMFNSTSEVSARMISDAVSQVAEAFFGIQVSSGEILPESGDEIVSVELLDRVRAMVQAGQVRAADQTGLDLEQLLPSNTASVSGVETLLTVAAALTVSQWFEVVDLQQLVTGLTRLDRWQPAANWIASAVTERGGIRTAIEVLEAAVTGDGLPVRSRTWLSLARVYSAARRPDLAISTLQSALRSASDDAELLRSYGSLLSQTPELDVVEQSAFGEKGQVTAEAEALAALELSLRAADTPEGRIASLYALVQASAGGESDVVWEYAGLLALEDKSGRFVDAALLLLLAREDFDRAVAPMKEATAVFSGVGRVWRNLAYAAYHSGQLDEAIEAASRAETLTEVIADRGELQLLRAYSEGKGAEQQFSELADRIAVGREASERELEFLEWIVESAPDYLEGYIVLARAYANQEEPSTALEVLLEAHQRIGDVPQLLNELADLLIEDEDLSVALDYVERALAADPQHVPSLVRAARVTFLLDDVEGAKVFLRQAHTLSPYNQEVVQLTREMTEEDN